MASKIVAGADPFGAELKDHLVSYLKGKGIEVEDLGTNKYYTVGEQVGQRISSASSSGDVKGLVVCGTGTGVGIFANKFKGVYATTCTSVGDAKNARSINNSNVLALGAGATPSAEAEKILDTWLSTEFKSPCPANKDQPWSTEVQDFLDQSVNEMVKVADRAPAASEACSICALASNRKFEGVDIMPGGSWCILREEPTSAVVRFKAGSVEPAHHHSFGHDLLVTSGKKVVWNLSKQQVFELGAGDFLYTPAGDVHRVHYLEDTEFFLRWDGPWDILLDEDLDTAVAAVDKASAAS